MGRVFSLTLNLSAACDIKLLVALSCSLNLKSQIKFCPNYPGKIVVVWLGRKSTKDLDNEGVFFRLLLEWWKIADKALSGLTAFLGILGPCSPM